MELLLFIYEGILGWFRTRYRSRISRFRDWQTDRYLQSRGVADTDISAFGLCNGCGSSLDANATICDACAKAGRTTLY